MSITFIPEFIPSFFIKGVPEYPALAIKEFATKNIQMPELFLYHLPLWANFPILAAILTTFPQQSTAIHIQFRSERVLNFPTSLKPFIVVGFSQKGHVEKLNT